MSQSKSTLHQLPAQAAFQPGSSTMDVSLMQSNTSYFKGWSLQRWKASSLAFKEHGVRYRSPDSSLAARPGNFKASPDSLKCAVAKKPDNSLKRKPGGLRARPDSLEPNIPVSPQPKQELSKEEKLRLLREQRWVLVVDVEDKKAELQRLSLFIQRLYDLCRQGNLSVHPLSQKEEEFVRLLLLLDSSDTPRAVLLKRSRQLEQQMQRLVNLGRYYYDQLRPQQRQQVLQMAAVALDGPGPEPGNWGVHWSLCTLIGYTESQILLRQRLAAY